jgi:hypothetical protein
MLHSYPDTHTAVPAPLSRESLPVQPTARSAHAHMLEVAAARRLRSVERAAALRPEDAGYWKAVAPAALAKARALREERSFAPLP